MLGRFLLMLCVIAIGLTACNTEATNGEEVIAKIHKKWKGNIPDHMTIDQRTVFYSPDGKVSEEQSWKLAIEKPDRMHIRINGFETGDGMLFKNDTAFYFQKGEHLASDFKVHYLLVLSYSIFVQEPSVTIAQLQMDEFQLGKMFTTTFDGKDVYVVGIADSTDTSSSYFVIDKKELVVLQTVRHRNGHTFEVQFKDYKEVDGHYMATTLVFSQKGVKTMSEHYENIQFPESLDDKLFSTKTFLEAKW